MATKKVKLGDIKKSSGRTSREDLDKLTDAKVNEAVLADKDAVIPTRRELEDFSKPKNIDGLLNRFQPAAKDDY